MGHEHEDGHECGCGCEGEEMNMEDLVFGLYSRLDALVALLIEKKIITEDEYESKVEEILEKEAAECDDCDDESEEDEE